MDPIFKPGEVLRVANPEDFLVARAKKIKDRDATLIENILDYSRTESGLPKVFRGRVLVRFEKKNGRGKEFQEVMRQSDFVKKE